MINENDYGRTGVGRVTRPRSHFKVIVMRRSEKQRLAEEKRAKLTDVWIVQIIVRWQSAIPQKKRSGQHHSTESLVLRVYEDRNVLAIVFIIIVDHFLFFSVFLLVRFLRVKTVSEKVVRHSLA